MFHKCVFCYGLSAQVTWSSLVNLPEPVRAPGAPSCTTMSCFFVDPVGLAPTKVFTLNELFVGDPDFWLALVCPVGWWLWTLDLRTPSDWVLWVLLSGGQVKLWYIHHFQWLLHNTQFLYQLNISVQVHSVAAQCVTLA